MAVSLRAIVPKRFRIIDPGVVNIQARAGIREYLEEVKKELQTDYSRVPTSPSYTRTRNLFRGWRIHVRSNNFGDLVNNIRYAGFVQGPNRNIEGRTRQSRAMRRRGWRSISTIARETRPKFTQIMNRRIRSTVK